MINAMEQNILATLAALKKETEQYTKEFMVNKHELTIRQNDLAVFSFMLKLVKCKKAAAFVQIGQHPAICETEGGLVFDFGNKEAEAEIQRKMTPSARAAIREILGRVEAVQAQDAASFLQKSVPTRDGGDDEDSLDDDDGADEMDKNEFEFNELTANLNAQLDVMRTSKAKFIVELNEAVANLASTQMELAEKEEERIELEKDYKVNMKLCKKRIEWIMFQDIYSYLKVRAKVMKFSKVSPPEKIVDCGVSAWIPGECSVPCDDKCPNKDPYKCGGTQTLTREVVVKNNQFGLLCPMLARKRKCNQVKCPVNCRQSRWSRYSKCSKDCEGGAQSRTRSILVQPKNGGQACNTAAETRPCNTGSCDRNCRLKKWTQWSPCSVACGGGFTERARKVLIPIRGNGRCPKSKSRRRYGFGKCNSHECV